MVEAAYRFRLRDDMPAGFRSNVLYPELPAAVAYLTPHDGHDFDSPELFEHDVLGGFLAYLEAEGVPEGEDPQLRKGLSLQQWGIPDNFVVYTPSRESHMKQCELGCLSTSEAWDRFTERMGRRADAASQDMFDA